MSKGFFGKCSSDSLETAHGMNVKKKKKAEEIKWKVNKRLMGTY